MQVLELVQRFAKAVGIGAPTYAVASTAEDIAQMVELLNQAGRAISRRYDWQSLTNEATFTTVATNSQGTLASIIGGSQTLRRIKNNTIWNRTTQQKIDGPVTAQTWQGYRAVSLTGPFPQYRIRGNVLMLDPAPTAGQTCYFEYVSACWCTSADGTVFRTNVAADSDVFLLDEELLLAELEWRWLRKKGLSYAEEFATAEGLIAEAIGSDGSKAVLNMASENRGPRVGIIVPQSGWDL